MNEKINEQPLISVIVPVYNVEKYLKKCVYSIINQTYKNIEVILVDDGSPDKCGMICDEFVSVDSRIKVIHKRNGGLSSARNAGIEIAKGQYIGFVDSDDTIEPFMYEKLYQINKKNKTLLSVCAVNYIFPNGEKKRKKELGEDRVFGFENAIIEMNMHTYFDMGAWSKLYDRNLFDGIRFPEGKLSEDFYIMYKVFDKAQKISYVDQPCYNYLQRKNSITHNIKINHDHEYAAKEQMLFLEKKYPQMKNFAHMAYASAALTVYDSYLKNGVKCPKDALTHFQRIIEDNYIYIKKIEYLPTKKKIQFKLFYCAKNIFYKISGEYDL